MTNVWGTNLNLFAAFDALLLEGNVTRAARRVGVTQSAMSSTLKQLRDLFEDPLFVRTQYGISPTEKALALGDPIRAGLAQFQRALEPSSFDPATAARTFVVQASDYMEFVMLPPLLRRLQNEAKGVQLVVRPWGKHEPSDELKGGEVDFMLGYTSTLPSQFHETILFEERYVCLVRQGHSQVKRKLGLETYLRLPHVVVTQSGKPGTASVDRALEELGKTRKVGATVSHFLMVPRLVAETDMVAALSERIARAFVSAFPLQVFSPPLSLPKGKPSVVWHERMHCDPGHRWLRQVISEIGREV